MNNIIFRNILQSSLAPESMICSEFNLRYGSVIYLGFGHKEKNGKFDVRQFEIEFGSESWSLFFLSNILLKSSDYDLERKILSISPNIIGHKFLDIFTEIDKSTIFISGGISIVSNISKNIPSGFLYSYDVLGNMGGITLDGVNVQLDPD